MVQDKSEGQSSATYEQEQDVPGSMEGSADGGSRVTSEGAVTAGGDRYLGKLPT